MKNIKYDLVLFGATGFTGRLVAEYLTKEYGVSNKKFVWAIAGREKKKLDNLKIYLSKFDSNAKILPSLIADSLDRRSLDNISSVSRLIISTVGPYLKYGKLLVESCVVNGTDYCDLTGEVPFIKESIDNFNEIAQGNRSRIIHSCGFDSIPSDIGVQYLQKAALERFGIPLEEIRLYVRAMRGGVSGGTIYSMINIYQYIKDKPKLQKSLKDPYSLSPKRTNNDLKKDLSSIRTVKWDPTTQRWICPFAMAGINTKIVRASNGIMNYCYGKGFIYSESVSFKKWTIGYLKACSMTLYLGVIRLSLSFKPLLAILKIFMPSPGQGPSRVKRKNGFFKMHLLGISNKKERLNLFINGNSDPGYSGTAAMITESALSLILEEEKIPKNFGVLTPASGIGGVIIKRLKDKGITFDLKKNK